ncbi:calcium-binding protein [Rhizobium ruizarguesonis]|uniref:Calcium-binding protein n=1 Tax=Rhizobium ruizarguesonis TaxID=2081791 RepID=A0ABY1WXC3_9HYPH|nr:calcium-binding protein [Rhizobium ruizarguesonis]TAU60891.1 calcium-binding protein [Rhizobium ruizarguesonis]TAV20932.1 calcium-binding protein [Rhizobium ruizarguesonis]TAV26181.1 calcium-binding protein [Rhizobium ruizarguesonis]TAW81062.1 calcium-binding protein [Rhizobium ruizarguesonis]TAX64076.1 calcium-binding protein [Rhizobium ruizarguesonis]
MGIQAVLGKLSWVNATPEEQGRIEGIISDLYRVSPNARDIFDLLAGSNKTLTFEHEFQTKAKPGEFLVKYNPTSVEGKCLIGSDGTVSTYSFEQALMHEIIHAVVGTSDGEKDGLPPNLLTGKYDYVGDTVPIEQLIVTDMTADPLLDPLYVDRASYHSTLYDWEVETLDSVVGESLTFGDPVKLVLVDDLGAELHGDAIDTRDLSDPVLLIGLDGSDLIHAGAGNDYLYGGVGGDTMFGGDGDDWVTGYADDDKLFGEAGSDYIVGGANNDILIGGFGDPDHLDLSTLHTEWYDGEQDFLVGGEGMDTFYIFATEGFYGSVTSNQITWDAIGKSDWIDKSDNDFVANIQIVQDNVWANFALTSGMVAAALSGYNGAPYLFGSTTFNTGGGSFQEDVLGKMVDGFFVVYTEVVDAKKILCVFPSLPEPEEQLAAETTFASDGFELWQSAQRSFDADLLLV